jgi:Mg-chelatase subunit ChlD
MCIILVDTSSSMLDKVEHTSQKSKIEAVRQAIPKLRASGAVVLYGLVGFGDHAQTYQRSTAQFGLIMSQGEMLQPEGMTNITAGLKEGLNLLGGRFAEKKRMILLSDGQANMEVADIDHYLNLCCEGGVVVDTISFGAQADKQRLKNIASKTGGVYCDAGDEKALQEAYAKLNYNVRYIEHKK